MDFPKPKIESVGWVPETSPHRGTTKLLYNNLITLFLCSWSAVHLNVPADGDTAVTIKFQKLKWMIVTILAPEFVSTYAYRDWKYATELKNACFDDWYGNQTDDYHQDCRNDPDGVRRYWPKIGNPWTMSHAFLLGMGGLTAELPQGPRVRLLTSDFCRLMDMGMSLPFISKEDIQDKSKASWFVKAIACVHIAWFFMQVGARYSQGLPVSPLELFSLAIVLCTLISYTLWWHKPLDVERPIIISIVPRNYGTVSQSLMNPDVRTIMLRCDVSQSEGISELAALRQRNSHLLTFYHGDRAYFMIIVSLAFGACHLAAWNWHFPSNIERWAWRIASMICAVFPVLFALEHVIVYRYRAARISHEVEEGEDTEDDARGITQTEDAIKGLDYIFIVPLYVLCRLYLAVEIFISIRSMPLSVYTNVQWLDYVPHF